MNSWIRRYLDPAERMTELLFGLIMTLTFTLGAGLIVKEGPDATRELLFGVIGCNLAWGLIDGLFYLFNAMFARGAHNRAIRLYQQQGRDALGARITDYVEETFGAWITPATREALKQDLKANIERSAPRPVSWQAGDFKGALASFVLVASTSLPALLPFLVIGDRTTALRVSNGLMILLVYVIGYLWAASIDAPRHRTALSMAILCVVVVGVTVALGG
jgi:VIT1/CCC1 family predicted Fe2+/Mn2+ transporter